MYRIFTRAWWKDNKDWPDGLEPAPGKKKHIKYVDTEKEAREFCIEWNRTHDEGRYSVKAEFEHA